MNVSNVRTPANNRANNRANGARRPVPPAPTVAATSNAPKACTPPVKAKTGMATGEKIGIGMVVAGLAAGVIGGAVFFATTSEACVFILPFASLAFFGGLVCKAYE